MIWGMTLEPGKLYTETMREEVQLSMAAMDSRRDFGNSTTNSFSQIVIQTSKGEYVLCTLIHSVMFQQNLDLRIMPREKVTFSVQGSSVVHLVGYTASYPQDGASFGGGRRDMRGDDDTSAWETLDSEDSSQGDYVKVEPIESFEGSHNLREDILAQRRIAPDCQEGEPPDQQEREPAPSQDWLIDESSAEPMESEDRHGEEEDRFTCPSPELSHPESPSQAPDTPMSSPVSASCQSVPQSQDNFVSPQPPPLQESQAGPIRHPISGAGTKQHSSTQKDHPRTRRKRKGTNSCQTRDTSRPVLQPVDVQQMGNTENVYQQRLSLPVSSQQDDPGSSGVSPLSAAPGPSTALGEGPISLSLEEETTAVEGDGKALLLQGSAVTVERRKLRKHLSNASRRASPIYLLKKLILEVFSLNELADSGGQGIGSTSSKTKLPLSQGKCDTLKDYIRSFCQKHRLGEPSDSQINRAFTDQVSYARVKRGRQQSGK